MVRRISLLLAAIALLALGISGPASAAQQAGVSAAVRGNIELTREQVVGRQIQSGEELYLQDAIKSGPQSGMQILLLDETTFTLGAESELVIDEFVYDPQSGAGKVGAQVVKGAFRFVTGRIAEGRPADMTVRLPAGTVGIRGTIAAGLANPVTQGSTVVLLGPGRETDPTEKIGALKVCNVGKCVGIRRPYFATRIPSGDEPPIRPFRISKEELGQLIGQLYAGAEPPTRVAGLPPVGAAGDEGGDGGPRPPIPSIPNPGSKEQQNPNVVDPSNGLSIATIDQLVGISSQNSGSAAYARFGIPLTDGGRYDFRANLDFGQQILSASASNIESPSLSLSRGFLGGSQSFEDSINMAPEARYQFSGSLENNFEELITADFFVGFFNGPDHPAGASPDFADSLLRLFGESPVETASAESPFGGALAPFRFGTNLSIATLAGISSQNSGLARYDRFGIPLDDGGSYDFSVELDFGQQIVDALAFNIDSPSLGLSFNSLSGTLPFGASALAPGARYLFTGVLFNQDQDQIAADLSVGFFNAPDHVPGRVPDRADSLLRLEDTGSGEVVATAGGESPFGGGLIPLVFETPFSIVTIDQLLSLSSQNSGSAAYVRSGIPLTDGGSYDFRATLDFGRQSVVVLASSIAAPSLSLSGGFLAGSQRLEDDAFPNDPDADYRFTGILENDSEQLITAGLAVAFFTGEGYQAGAPPDFADSVLSLSPEFDASVVSTALSESPLGGALAALAFETDLSIATIDQLVGISSQNSGLAFYSRSGIPLTDGGSYDFRALLDFGELIVDAEAFNIQSVVLGLDGASAGGIAGFGESLIAPQTGYFFHTSLFNGSEDLIEARLFVAFSNAPDASAANPPDFADSLLELENLDDSDALLVTTAAGGPSDRSPLGGILAAHQFSVPSVDDLLAIPSGLATYERFGIPLNDGGRYDFVANLDFDQQLVSALAFNIESLSFDLIPGQSVGGTMDIGSSSEPGGFYPFFGTLFEMESQGSVNGFLQVDFFSAPRTPAGAAPDFAGSFLGLDDGSDRFVETDFDPTLPRSGGGALVPLLDDTLLSISTITELASVTSGSATYFRSGIPLTDGGSYDFDVRVDFGQQLVDAFAFNIEAPSLGLSQEVLGGIQGFQESIIAPQADYQFSDVLFNSSEQQIAADLLVGFFNAPGHQAGTAPDLADSLLTLENLDDATAAIVETVPDQSPLGGALVPPQVFGEGQP